MNTPPHSAFVVPGRIYASDHAQKHAWHLHAHSDLTLSFAALSRWQRISLVRDLANAKVQDGDSTVSARYARERKHSALELLEKARHKARNVFDRQVCPLALTNSVLSSEQYCKFATGGLVCRCSILQDLFLNRTLALCKPWTLVPSHIFQEITPVRCKVVVKSFFAHVFLFQLNGLIDSLASAGSCSCREGGSRG